MYIIRDGGANVPQFNPSLKTRVTNGDIRIVTGSWLQPLSWDTKIYY